MKDKKVGVGFGVMILKEGQVLLGRRHDDAQKADSELHGEGTWTMPGGKLDFLEKPEDGARREVLEETGFKVGTDNLKMISFTNDMTNDSHFVTCGFLCQEFEGEPQVLEPDEITEWNWFSLDSLPSPMFPPSIKIIKNYQEGEFYKN